MTTIPRHLALLAAVAAFTVWPLAADAMPDVNAVWLYLNFDDTLDAVVPADGMRVTGFTGGRDGKPVFVPGRRGLALDVRPQRGDTVSIQPGLPGFPVEKGSLLLWFRPSWAVDTPQTHWLVEGQWAKFSIQQSGARLLAYATDSHRNFVNAPLTPLANEWTDRWHLLIMTWQPGAAGSDVRVYLDGAEAGHLADVAPMREGPSVLHLGCLPQPKGKPSTAHIDGAIDEFAILTEPLTAADAAALYRAGDKGLIGALGGGVYVRMRRHAYVRGEPAEITVEPYAEWDEAVISAVGETTAATVPLVTLQSPVTQWTLDTEQLRPGRYRLQVELRREGQTVASNDDTWLAVRASREPPFPVGLSGLLSSDDEMLARAEAWHISHDSPGGYTSPAPFRDVDRLFRYGIAMMPGLNMHFHRFLPLDPAAGYYDATTGRGTPKLVREVLQNLVLDGDTSFAPFTSSIASPYSTVAREAMRARVRRLLEDVDGHPGLVGLAFDDEYVLRTGTDKESGKRYYGDYGPQARARFKEQTGLDPVYPPKAEPGTIFPDDHPYFRWRDAIGMPNDATCAGLASNNAMLTELVHDLRPDILTTTYSGGEYGEVDAVMDYVYPVIWQPGPSYAHGHGRLDFVVDRHRARQRVTPLKPIWGLTGWWSDDLRGQPDWCVTDFKLNNVMALAKGLKRITWFTAWDGTMAPDQFGGGVLSRPDLRAEMVQWADWLHRFGPMFAELETRPYGQVAVLFSEDNRAGKVHRGGSPDDFKWIYPAMRIAGAGVDLVSDRHVKAGALDAYDALALLGFEYAGDSLWRAIQRFAATPGKKVFVDETTVLRPDDTIDLGVALNGHVPMAGRPWGMPIVLETYAAMTRKLRETLRPHLEPGAATLSGSDYVAPHWLYGGDGRVLALANYHVHTSQTVRVSIAGTPNVYDIRAGRRMDGSAWEVTIAPGDGAMYWLSPAPLGAPDCTFAFLDGAFTITVAARDASGGELHLALPLRVELVDPNGENVDAYEQFAATSPANGRVTLRLPRAGAMDGAGSWGVVVTELISGRQARRDLTVPK